MATGTPNVWTQMNYVPPRGQCNYKESILSSRCTCLRFMLHPLKLSSSYGCDGCSHHASFHSMENKTEDEIRKRWEQEAKEKTERETEAQQRPKKRVRAIEYNNSKGGVLEDPGNVFGIATACGGGNTRAKGRGGKQPAGTAVSRAKSRITEAADEDDAVVELD